MREKCEIAFCREVEDVSYYGHPVCWKHWKEHCKDDSTFNLKEKLGIKEARTECKS